MFSKILSEVKTTEDKAMIEIALNELLININQPNVDIKSLIKKTLPVRFWNQIEFDPTSPDNEKSIKLLLDKLDKLRVSGLTIAIDPTEKFLDSVVGWCRKNIGEDVIVEIQRDKSLVCGVKITFEGRYEDYSLNKKLQNFNINSNA